MTGMEASRQTGDWLVPHDIAGPIAGAHSGALAGLTTVVKDSFDIAGERTGGGSPEWLAAQRPASRHAWAVDALLGAGATVVGKAVCDEFFYSLTGANAHYGTPANVRAPGRVPGGSSSGSAAAAAAGVCDFALGGDTGGSVRIPAALCGLYGIRTTHGRVNSTGAMSMAPSFDTIGWFAATPGVLRSVGPVLLDESGAQEGIARLVVADDAFEEADHTIAELVRSFLRSAAVGLPDPEHRRIADGELDTWREAFQVVQASEVWQTFGSFVTRVRPSLGPGIKERMAAAAQLSEDEIAFGREAARAAREHVHDALDPGTVMAIPTAPSIAPMLDADDDALDRFRQRTMRLTCIAGLSGLPQVTLPVATTSGCPVGISFVGWPGSDERLLELAVALAPYISASNQA